LVLPPESEEHHLGGIRRVIEAEDHDGLAHHVLTAQRPGPFGMIGPLQVQRKLRAIHQRLARLVVDDLDNLRVGPSSGEAVVPYAQPDAPRRRVEIQPLIEPKGWGRRWR
jgi:hypothetical protein